MGSIDSPVPAVSASCYVSSGSYASITCILVTGNEARKKMEQPRRGGRKSGTRIPPLYVSGVRAEARPDARCATVLAAPMRLGLFNLSVVVLLPLLGVLVSPIYVSSFVVVVPPTNYMSPAPSSRCGESSPSGRGRIRSALAASLASAGASGEHRRKLSNALGTRRHALQDELLEGIAAAAAPDTEASLTISCCSPTYCVVV